GSASRGTVGAVPRLLSFRPTYAASGGVYLLRVKTAPAGSATIEKRVGGVVVGGTRTLAPRRSALAVASSVSGTENVTFQCDGVPAGNRSSDSGARKATRSPKPSGAPYSTSRIGNSGSSSARCSW